MIAALGATLGDPPARQCCSGATFEVTFSGASNLESGAIRPELGRHPQISSLGYLTQLEWCWSPLSMITGTRSPLSFMGLAVRLGSVALESPSRRRLLR